MQSIRWPALPGEAPLAVTASLGPALTASAQSSLCSHAGPRNGLGNAIVAVLGAQNGFGTALERSWWRLDPACPS
jgi:hypothetical protein